MNGVMTRSCPSQSPIDIGRPFGGDTKAHVILVPTFGFVAENAEPMNVPVAERSVIVRLVPQFVITGVPMNWLTAERG